MNAPHWLRARLLACLLCAPLAASSAARAQSTGDAGKAALDKGDYAAAEVLYRKALREHPAQPELLSNLGVALQMQGRSTEAMHAFEQALKLKKLPRTYALLAQERCRTRDLDGARPMLERILKEEASDPLILALAAPCYLDLDEPIEAAEAFTALLADSSYPHDYALIQLAKSYALAGQFFFSRLTHTPENARYVAAIGAARDQTAPDARSAFADAARLSPYFRADLSFPEAVGLWRQHPGDPALLYLLCVLSGEGSIHNLEICAEKYPDSPYFEQMKLEMQAEQGREEEAIQGYEALMQAHPELSDLPYSLGMLYIKQRQWEKAAEVFRVQLSRHPQDERSAAHLSEALERLSRWSELRTFLTPLMQQANPPLWASTDLAEAEENLGDPKAAIRVLAAAEKANMSSKAIHFRLVHLYRMTGNLAQAQVESQWFKQAGQ
jgi:tetratricopeptide (TPR) repeat protein